MQTNSSPRRTLNNRPSAAAYSLLKETQNELITPGRGARITGSLLKFDEEDASQGVFFVNLGDRSETRVESRMLRNKPGELIFNNPELPAGTYRLEVRSILQGNKEVRTGTLQDVVLTVAGSGS